MAGRAVGGDIINTGYLHSSWAGHLAPLRQGGGGQGRVVRGEDGGARHLGEGGQGEQGVWPYEEGQQDQGERGHSKEQREREQSLG